MPSIGFESTVNSVLVARIDGDVWVHVGNLIHYLRGIPQKGVLAGSLHHIRNGRTIDYKGVTIIPYDCPHRIVYVDGGAYIVSRDAVPYISIGAQYLSVLLPVSEDVIVTEALLRAGIHVYPSSQNHTIIVTYRRGMIIPPNTLFFHRIKDISLFKYIYANYSDVYLSPEYIICLLSISLLFLTRHKDLPFQHSNHKELPTNTLQRITHITNECSGSSAFSRTRPRWTS